MTEESTRAEPSLAPSEPTLPKKKRHILRYILCSCIALLSGMFGGATWLLTSESGLHFTVFTLPKLVDVQVRSDALSGSILGGFSARNLNIHTPTSDWRISQMRLAWQPRQLLNAHLHINEIALGDIHLTSHPQPDKSNTPPTLPESLDLPFSITLDNISIGQFTQNTQHESYIKGIQLSYTFNHQNHQISLKSLRTYWSHSTGQIRLNAATPFTLTGAIHSTGQLDNIAVTNQIKLSGSLKSIALSTHLQGQGVFLRADTQLRPFSSNIAEQLGRINVVAHGINPNAFLPSLPHAQLTLDLKIFPRQNKRTELSGSLNMRNTKPFAADQNGIPIQTLSGVFHVNPYGDIDINDARAHLMQHGEITLTGSITAAQQALNLRSQLTHITAADALSTPIKGTLGGELHATGTFSRPIVRWQLNTKNAASSGSLKLIPSTQQNTTLVLENGIIQPKNGGILNLSAQVDMFDTQKWRAQLQTQAFNPNKLYPDFPVGKITGNIKLNGELAHNVLHSELTFAPSVLSGAPLAGNGKITYENNHLNQADLAIYLGENRVLTRGAFGKKGDALALDIHAPQLDLFGFGLRGLLTAKGNVINTADGFAALEAKLDGRAQNFAIADYIKIQQLNFHTQVSPEPTRPLSLTLKGNGIHASGTLIDTLEASVNGTLRQHALKVSGNLKVDSKPLSVNVAASGGVNEQNQWLGTVSTLNVAGALQLHLQNALRLEAGAKRVQLSAAHWAALGGSLRLEQLVWDAQNGLHSKGNATGLQLAQLHHFYTPPVEHNLTIAAQWDMAYSSAPRGFINIKQQAGDVLLPPHKQPLGLQNLTLNTTLDTRGIHNQLHAKTSLANVSGDYHILSNNGALLSAPVSGSLKVGVNDLSTSLKSVLPIGQIVKGSLNADVVISGTVRDPQLRGTVNGENLYYRNRQIGVVLDNGSLKSHLDKQTWHIDALQFKRKDGTVTLSGSAAYLNDAPNVQAKLAFEHYPILDQPQRRLTLSGGSNVFYTANGIELSGSLKTNEGRFGFQESSAPTLDDDVIILGENTPSSAKIMPFKLNLDFDLSDNFHFSGEGLNVTLGGKLHLTSHTTNDVQAVGSVYIRHGRYKAYGQDLIIKKGVISFVGSLNQPNLNIRAERRSSPVGAGVEVLGNLDTPRISLVANEPMSEKDKLSWLILNRASSGSSSDNAALATAASAFLAGKINDKIGLVDDFGLTSQQTRNAQTGEMNPAQQVLTFGKQLTRNLYLGYEAGLQTSSQTVKLVYQLSRSFQAVARGGTESSGGEIKYIKRFD